MTANDPAKRIPKSIGTETKLFGKYTLTDMAVALFPGVLVILVTQMVIPPNLRVGSYPIQTLTLPLAGLAIVVGALFVYLTPGYTTSVDWLATFIGFQRQPKSLAHEKAKTLTQVEQVHQGRRAIERVDGVYLGAVRVAPASLALATDDDWAATADAFQDFLNTAIDFPVQFYSTTQEFPVEEYLGHYRRRLDDPDVKANPRLAALITNYIEWYAADVEQRRTTIRDHYVLVPVTPAEVQFERESLTEQLGRLPVLGVFVQAWLAPRQEERSQAMFDALDERLRRVERGIRELDGCSAQRIDAEDLTQLLGEFWTGESYSETDLSTALRTRPLLGGARQ